MSRTDKTKPLRVRHAEHDPRPVHDHRYGACDLPSGPLSQGGAETRCRWEHPAAHLFSGNCCAGCKVRSHITEWQEWKKAGNRRERYEGRREARRLAGEEDGE